MLLLLLLLIDADDAVAVVSTVVWSVVVGYTVIGPIGPLVFGSQMEYNELAIAWILQQPGQGQLAVFPLVAVAPDEALAQQPGQGQIAVFPLAAVAPPVAQAIKDVLALWHGTTRSQTFRPHNIPNYSKLLFGGADP